MVKSQYVHTHMHKTREFLLLLPPHQKKKAKE